MKLWTVDNGDTIYNVGAADPEDAKALLAEQWGQDTWEEYAEDGVQVVEVAREVAERISFVHEDEPELTNLWEAWQADPSRCIVGSSDY